MSAQIKNRQRVKNLGEVYTAQKEVKAMCDMVDISIKDIYSKILEPACGNGNFLEEIFKRRLQGSSPKLNTNDILISVSNIYGIDIDENNISECKNRLLKVVKEYKMDIGEDLLTKVSHILDKNLIKADTLEDFEGIEFVDFKINREEIKEETILGKDLLNKRFKFNTIIGNPPYQKLDGGHSASAVPLYHKFIEKSKKLEPDYICMIIPARWYIGGRGLESFRKDMLQDKRIVKMVDHHLSTDCFEGVDIEGGVCYFLWDKGHNGDCEVVSIKDGVKTKELRDLGEFDIFVRYNDAISILEKIKNKEKVGDKPFGKTMDSVMTLTRPFGIRTNFKDYYETKKEKSVKFYGNKVVSYVDEEKITNNKDLVGKYKVLISAAYGMGKRSPYQVIGKPFIVEPNSCCSETYIVCGSFDDEKMAMNLKKYVETKFFRFLTLLRKGTQHNPSDRFSFIPVKDFKNEIEDEDLYLEYGLTKKEIEYIESLVRKMK